MLNNTTKSSGHSRRPIDAKKTPATTAAPTRSRDRASRPVQSESFRLPRDGGFTPSRELKEESSPRWPLQPAEGWDLPEERLGQPGSKRHFDRTFRAARKAGSRAEDQAGGPLGDFIGPNPYGRPL